MIKRLGLWYRSASQSRSVYLHVVQLPLQANASMLASVGHVLNFRDNILLNRVNASVSPFLRNYPYNTKRDLTISFCNEVNISILIY